MKLWCKFLTHCSALERRFGGYLPLNDSTHVLAAHWHEVMGHAILAVLRFYLLRQVARYSE